MNNQFMPDRYRYSPPSIDTPPGAAPSAEDGFYASYRDSAETGGAVRSAINSERIAEASEILQKYKNGKANLEEKIIDNEEWYRMHHWGVMRGKAKRKEVKPSSAWLFNSIANKHADAMDNYPNANILPREEGDKNEAKKLSSIIPVVLDQAEFEQTYSDVWLYKLKTGTGVYAVLWDKTKHNGLGDISITKVDLLNLFWEPGVNDIQQSRNVFLVTLVDNDVLEEEHPSLVGKLGSSTISVSQYIYDDSIDTSDKSAVVDWYYKVRKNGRTVVHYVKYVNDEILYATENDPDYAERGIYDHGMYPFVFDVLNPIEGSPAGFGYIDVGKDAQEYIDRGNQAILRNMLVNAKPRFFVNESGNVNEEEYADTEKDLVHFSGTDPRNSIMPITGASLSGIYVTVLNNKIEELKETTGNRDVSNGGTTSGVTAASAIAAMQEAGSKLSRDAIKSAYRAFKNIIWLVIELIRQFYDVPRQFRILGQNGAEEFTAYSNEGIVPQPQGTEFDVDMGYRLPVFDIEVTAQKQSPYTKMSQNELALQFYNAGFFNPQMADMALACLDMMDFDRKSFVVQKIERNGTMYQQIQALRQQVLSLSDTLTRLTGQNVIGAAADAMGMTGEAGVPMMTGEANPEALDPEGTESPNVARARERAAEATAPR